MKKYYTILIEAANISALSSGKIGKYEYLTGEEILPSDQSRIIQHAKFTYSYSFESLKNRKIYKT